MCTIEVCANIAAVAGAIISVAVYRHAVKRERKINTIREYVRIRNQFPYEKIPENQLKPYLREMEFFCTGINEGLYDFGVLRKMSGRRLLSQYNNYMREYISDRRTRIGASSVSWVEYEKVMGRLQCRYCPVRKRFRTLFCRF